MTVTVAQVATELARPVPTSPTSDQWQSWIDRAYRLIEARRVLVGLDAFDAELLDDVVLMTVAEHVRRWRESTASRRTVSVDDATITTQHESSVGLLEIPDDLWRMLDPASTVTEAFTITPYAEPDPSVTEYWA